MRHSAPAPLSEKALTNEKSLCLTRRNEIRTRSYSPLLESLDGSILRGDGERVAIGVGVLDSAGLQIASAASSRRWLEGTGHRIRRRENARKEEKQLSIPKSEKRNKLKRSKFAV